MARGTNRRKMFDLLDTVPLTERTGQFFVSLFGQRQAFLPPPPLSCLLVRISILSLFPRRPGLSRALRFAAKVAGRPFSHNHRGGLATDRILPHERDTFNRVKARYTLCAASIGTIRIGRVYFGEHNPSRIITRGDGRQHSYVLPRCA